MTDQEERSSFSLPKNWPRRVRSAIVHVVSMANVALTAARGRAEHHFDARVRLRAENVRLEQEIALLREELRIKDARMERVPAQRRPHYPPVERLAILELRAARGLSLAETARRLLVTPLTIASWNRRLDDAGTAALIQVREPVNRFPEFVAYLVRRLRVLCPTMGSRRIASVLARAGLHLGATTIRRMLVTKPTTLGPARSSSESKRVVTARQPDHVWHVDLTTVPTSLGFWLSWSPFALPQRWPFCWWVGAAVDHFSRRVMGLAVFATPPTARRVTAFLDHAAARATGWPAHLITDHGKQFTARAFRKWCTRRGIRQRFGAVGKYGSIAVVERFIRSLKDECTRSMVVPLRRDALLRDLDAYARWFNADRPHERLRGVTPDEVYFRRRPASRLPRFEPRARWPRSSSCARPQALVRGRPGVEIELVITHRDGRKHLPIVTLRPAA